MVYRITLTDTATYEFDSSLYTPKQAEALARDWFIEREPDIEFETLAPCEVDGNCPYEDYNCSLCHEEET